MSDINIDDFFKDAAIALVQLYGMFPRRHALFVEGFKGIMNIDISVDCTIRPSNLV